MTPQAVSSYSVPTCHVPASQRVLYIGKELEDSPYNVSGTCSPFAVASYNTRPAFVGFFRSSVSAKRSR